MGIGRRLLQGLRFAALAVLLLILQTSVGLAWRVEVAPIRAVSAILIEPTSGQVLYEQNADAPRAPASIAKTMLELVVLEKIQAGELKLDEPITASAWASKIGGSQVYLREGETFPLEDLMKAIVIHSANDACVAVAEHIAGSADGFVDLENIQAREMGLTATHFINVHGLDDEPGQGNVTSARDISRIAQKLISMPHVLEWSSIQETPFRDGAFLLQNTNKLLGRFPGLDGLKTGYTHKAGFCLCATAERKGLRLVSVVLGAESNKARFEETARLLGAGFAQLSLNALYAAGDPIPGGVPVARGREPRIESVAGAPLAVILPRRAEVPKAVLIPKKGLCAPIKKGDTVGSIEVTLESGETLRAPVVAASDMKKETIFQSIARAFGGGRS
jgi:serine-type D-Ala-D-Ala carboxypeptidase (penicillin-binding protein 5/6)